MSGITYIYSSGGIPFLLFSCSLFAEGYIKVPSYHLICFTVGAFYPTDLQALCLNSFLSLADCLKCLPAFLTKACPLSVLRYLMATLASTALPLWAPIGLNLPALLQR